jgi:flavin-dependent dehydrogenase
MRVGVRQYVRGISPEHTVATAFMDLDGHGYFWFFPFFRDDECWANMGWWQFGGRRMNPRRRLLFWLENRRIRGLLAGGSTVGDVRGCPINVARIRGLGRLGLARRPWGPGYLLVGDASGLAHPLTGGGIELALFSGRCAGSLVAKGLPMADLGTAYERESLRFARSAYGLLTSQLMLSMPSRLSPGLSTIYLNILKSFLDRSGHLGKVLDS